MVDLDQDVALVVVMVVQVVEVEEKLQTHLEELVIHLL